MRPFSCLVLLVLSTTRVAAAQSTRPHRWAQLIATASEAIDLDTATVQRTDGLRRVLAVETHEISTPAVRRLPDSPAAPRPPDTISSSDSVWHAVSSGSLADMVAKAVCRWREAGA